MANKRIVDPEKIINDANDQIQKLTDEVSRLRAFLADLRAWADAYPTSVFREPDFAKAHKVLTENGMTLDALSASTMRFMTEDLRRRIDAAAESNPQDHGAASAPVHPVVGQLLPEHKP